MRAFKVVMLFFVTRCLILPEDGVVTINPERRALLQSCQGSVLFKAMSQRCERNAKDLTPAPTASFNFYCVRMAGDNDGHMS